MDDATQRFSDRAAYFAKYRPGYPPQVLDVLRRECGLTPASVVADVGSGTGIWSQVLLRHGNRVYGVEPNEPMRMAAEKLLAGYPDFTSVPGTAEETTLSDATVDFVTAAQAFHWFKREKAAAEFRRILKPGGHVVLLWNERRLGSTPFLRDYEKLLLEFAPDYPVVKLTLVDETTLRKFFGPLGFRKRSFENRQVFDYEGLRGRLLSSSYTPPVDHHLHAPMLEAVRRLFETHQQNDTVTFDYDTNVYFGRLGL